MPVAADCQPRVVSVCVASPIGAGPPEAPWIAERQPRCRDTAGRMPFGGIPSLFVRRPGGLHPQQEAQRAHGRDGSLTAGADSLETSPNVVTPTPTLPVYRVLSALIHLRTH